MFHTETDKINQPVTIRDITIINAEGRYLHGESDRIILGIDRESAMVRLAKHIEMLANIANTYHQKCYGYDDKSNNITRLSLSEFSLFTANPISWHDFTELKKLLADLASQLHPNVHLVLNSFAVMDENGRINNDCLYVHGGNEDSVFHLSKPLAVVEGSKEDIPTYGLTLPVLPSSGKSLYYNAVFPIRTAGGAEYLQAVEVDAKSYAEKLRASNEEHSNAETALMPRQVDHLVLSAHARKKLGNISEQPPVHISSKTTSENLDKSVSPNVAELASAFGYLTATQTKQGIRVSNPKFGTDFLIERRKVRALGGFHPDIKKDVVTWNRQANTTAQDGMPPIVSQDTKRADRAKQDEDILGALNEMIDKANKLCRYHFFEFLFNYGRYTTYRYFKDAIKIIEITRARKGDLSEKSLPILKGLNKSLKSMESEPPKTYQKQCVAAVDEALSRIKKIIDEHKEPNRHQLSK